MVFFSIAEYPPAMRQKRGRDSVPLPGRYFFAVHNNKNRGAFFNIKNRMLLYPVHFSVPGIGPMGLSVFFEQPQAVTRDY
jgi:hypothetical protein